MNWFLKALKQYTNFDGRAKRKEFWMFILFSIIFFIGAMIINEIMGVKVLYFLCLIIPGIAISVRRLHDIGKSGWMLLINLIPVVGWVLFIIFMASKGNQRKNSYGQNPDELTINKI